MKADDGKAGIIRLMGELATYNTLLTEKQFELDSGWSKKVAWARIFQGLWLAYAGHFELPGWCIWRGLTRELLQQDYAKTQKPVACLGYKYCHNVTIASGIGTPEEKALEAAEGGSINNCQEQGRQANLMGELSPLRAW